MTNTIITHAYANIALIKYWGKRDEQLLLPTKSSLSLTLPQLKTTTRITRSVRPFETLRSSGRTGGRDVITLNGKLANAKAHKQITNFLDYFRNTYKISDHFLIESENSFPTAAGLASSASGFATLAKGLNQLYSLNLSHTQLSILARQGSGSACRSMYDGFVLWHKGERADGADSYAEQLFDAQHWPKLCMLVVVVTDTPKKISSRIGMQQTVATSPDYENWIKKSELRIPLMIDAIKNKNFEMVGTLAEQDCIDMHYCMRTTTQPLNYWTKQTVALINLVKHLRINGTPCYYTIDAGPNVKVLCLKKDIQKIQKFITQQIRPHRIIS